MPAKGCLSVLGRRVAKVGSKLYWYGSGGEVLAETDTLGNVLNEYVYFGGKRIALLPTGGSAQFYVEDMLGSSRVITTNTGVVCYDADFYPYGGERPIATSCTQNNYKFEGKERDVETSVGSGNTNGNDDFGARYYSNRFGRWLSADWSNVAAPVPYANLSNPQTLNLYAMVADDPESFADLDGHQPSCGGPNGPGGGQGGGPDCPEIDRERTADTNNSNAANNQNNNKPPAQKGQAQAPESLSQNRKPRESKPPNSRTDLVAYQRG